MLYSRSLSSYGKKEKRLSKWNSHTPQMSLCQFRQISLSASKSWRVERRSSLADMESRHDFMWTTLVWSLTQLLTCAHACFLSVYMDAAQNYIPSAFLQWNNKKKLHWSRHRAALNNARSTNNTWQSLEISFPRRGAAVIFSLII